MTTQDENAEARPDPQAGQRLLPWSVPAQPAEPVGPTPWAPTTQPDQRPAVPDQPPAAPEQQTAMAEPQPPTPEQQPFTVEQQSPTPEQQQPAAPEQPPVAAPGEAGISWPAAPVAAPFPWQQREVTPPGPGPAPAVPSVPAPPVPAPAPAPIPSPWGPPPGPPEPDDTAEFPAVRVRSRRRLWLIPVAVVLLGLIGGAVWVVGADGLRGHHPVATGSLHPTAGTTNAAKSGVDEEFTGPTLDTRRWGIYTGTSSNGSVRTTSAVQIVDGQLQIIGTGRDPSGKGDQSGGLCWCGTDGNHTYGTWRVRARFDAGAGYSQIVGLWPQSNNSSDGSVIFAGTPEADKHTLHGSVMWSRGAGTSAERTLTGDFTGWHVYTIVWRPDSIRMDVDGIVFFDSTSNAAGISVPQHPMHLYIQQDVGPLDGVPAPNPSTPEHVLTQVDWVRYSP